MTALFTLVRTQELARISLLVKTVAVQQVLLSMPALTVCLQLLQAAATASRPVGLGRAYRRSARQAPKQAMSLW